MCCPRRWSLPSVCCWRSSPSLGTAISAARPEQGGLASGIVNTSYQVGSALGLAAITAAAYGADQATDPAALTVGLSAAHAGAAAIA